MISRIRLPTQALAILLCAKTASAQENRGSPEQRAACASDAFRFCVTYIPDPARHADRYSNKVPPFRPEHPNPETRDDQFDPRRPQRPIEPATRRL
jgi:hypothetical protein